MTQSEPAELRRQRLEWIVVGAVSLLLFFVHWRFLLSGFGEQDAGRLASDAIHWHFERSIDMTKVDYRMHTSPLYIHGLKLLLDHGLSIRKLPGLMNGVSAFFSSLCCVGLYLLFRKLTTRPIAATATLVYAFTPCFWLGSVYGMPTLLALTWLVFGALAFHEAAAEPDLRSVRAAAFLALSALLVAVAFALKADMALSGGALLTVLVARGRIRPALFGAAVVVVGLGTLFTIVYAHRVAAPIPEAAVPKTHAVSGFLESWNGRFPFRWSLLVDPKNNAPITHASGALLFAICFLALLHGLTADGQRLRLTLGAALWGLPPLLFWGLKPGNSARHNLPAFAPLVLLAIVLLFELCSARTKRALFLVGLVLAAGQLDLSGFNSVTPRVDVLTATEQVEHSTSSLHERAREFMNGPSPKKALIETEYLLPYSEFEAWAAAQHPALRARPRAILDGSERETRVVLVGNARAARSQAQSLRSQGFEVFSLQFSL